MDAANNKTPSVKKHLLLLLMNVIIAAMFMIFLIGFWSDVVFWIRLNYYFEGFGSNKFGYKEYRHRKTNIVFVRLPGGVLFLGGQNSDPNGRNYDPEINEYEPSVHKVALKSFMIAKYEVTQDQWVKMMGTNPSQFLSDRSRPVENISWNDVQIFLKKSGLSIPTEDQWEYACRGGSTTSNNVQIDEYAWYVDNSGGCTHSVGSKKPNGFGLYDMLGNVWEFCENYWDPACEKGNNPVAKYWRTARGGGWCDEVIDLRPTHGKGDDPSIRYEVLGFRPVWLVP